MEILLFISVQTYFLTSWCIQTGCIYNLFLRLFTVEVSKYKNVSTTFGLHLIFIETKLFRDFSNFFSTNDLCSMNLISLVFVCFSFIAIDSSKIEENIKSG